MHALHTTPNRHIAALMGACTRARAAYTAVPHSPALYNAYVAACHAYKAAKEATARSTFRANAKAYR